MKWIRVGEFVINASQFGYISLQLTDDDQKEVLCFHTLKDQKSFMAMYIEDPVERREIFERLSRELCNLDPSASNG